MAEGGSKQLWKQYVREYGDEDESGHNAADDLEENQAQCRLCGQKWKGASGTR